MKSLVRKTSLFFLALAAFSVTAYGQAQKKADKATEAWKYEIEAVQTGTQGTYLIKVWSYSKKATVATTQAKKNAVHGIIFQGFTGKPGVPGQKALTNNPNLEIERADYFDPFFSEGGKYMKFVSSSSDGAIEAGDVQKVGKLYKVGVVVSVNVAALRKDLEDAGIIKGLSSGF